MARTNKTGLIYFTHDVDMADDPKMRLLKARHGIAGYAVFNLLLESIYRGNGYYLAVTPEWVTVFAADCRLCEDELRVMIAGMARIGLFSNRLYTEEGILTSARVQTTYIDGSERRAKLVLQKQFMLVDPMELRRVKAKWQLVLLGGGAEPCPVKLTQGLVPPKPPKAKEKEIKGNEIKTKIKPKENSRLMMYEVFCQAYQAETGTRYATADAGADADALCAVTQAVLAESPANATDEERMECMRVFFTLAQRVNDEWLRKRVTPKMLAWRLNDYLKAIHQLTGTMYGTANETETGSLLGSIGIN